MIFVTIGTQKQQFTRLLELIENSKLLENEEIIAQVGNTIYESKRINQLKFMAINEIKDYMKKAEFVITHGGVGSIIDALNLGKKVIAVPRLAKFKEHVDNHQMEICDKLSKEGYIEQLLENENIDEKVEKLRKNSYKKYENDDKYLEIIEKDIEQFIK